MKKLGYKVLLYAVIVLLIAQLSKLIFSLSYYWGNPWYGSKIEFLKSKNTKDLPNTFFFGSSRVHRQIDPAKFDQTLDTISTLSVNSFNLGAPATFCPQTYYLYENFIQSDIASNTKYVFMELMNIELINENVMHQSRTIYWQNFSTFKFVMKAIFSDDQVDWKHKFGYLVRYGISFIESQYRIGFLGQLIVKKTDFNREFVGPETNGYYPLESELKVTTNRIIKNDLVKRKSSLDGDTTSLSMIALSSIKNFEDQTSTPDSIHLEKINDLIKISKDKHIKLIFVLSPRNSSSRLVSLYKSIPASNKIDLSNAAEFPELYTKENTFDIDHLNTKGSEIYSTLLAEKFKDLIVDK